MSLVLPVEVLEKIIKILIAQRNPGEDHETANLHTLRSLARTCKHFYYLSQPEIFKHIALGFTNPQCPFTKAPLYSDNDMVQMKLGIHKRLKNLVQAIDTNPLISSWVEELALSASSFYDLPMTEFEWATYGKCLTSFPRLRFLGFSEDPRGLREDRWHVLQGTILEAYSLQGHINTIRVKGPIYHIPWNHVLSNPNARTLTLNLSPMIITPEAFFNTSNITNLGFIDQDEFPMSILLALPHLEVLCVKTNKLHPPPASDLRSPSSNLKEITLRLPRGNLAHMLVLFLKRVKQPFRRLEKVDVTFSNNQEALALCRALEGVNSLQELVIDGTLYKSGPFPIITLGLDKAIRSCTKINLSLRMPKFPTAEYNTSVTELVSLITSIKGNNALQSLSLTMKSDYIDRYHERIFAAWSDLPCFLGNEDAFPFLHEVRWRTYLAIADGQNKPNHRLTTALKERLAEVMLPFNMRKGLNQLAWVKWE